MAFLLKINNVDKTSLVKRPSTIISKGADNRSNAEFSLITTALDIGTADGIIVGQDVQISDGGLLFGGIIQSINIIKLEPGLGNTKTIEILVNCTDYGDIPARRVTTSLFNDETAGNIVTALVNNVLNLTGFDDNVGLGTIDSGATFVQYSAVAKSVKEILDDLAITSGFKWYIDDAKDLYFVQEDTIVAAAHDLVEVAATFTDFQVLDLNISLENYRNKQWVIGDKNDVGEVVVTDAADNTEIATRAAIEGTSGVYGNIIKTSDAQNDTDADDAALNGLKQYGIIPYILEFSSLTNDWVVGTKLKVNLPSIGIPTDTYFLIETVELEDEGCNFRTYVTASRRKELDFSTQRTENYVDYFAKMVNNPLNIGTGGSGGSSGQNTFDSYLFMSNDASFDITTVLGNENRDLVQTFTSHVFVDINLTGVADQNTELRSYLYLGVWNGASYDYNLQKTFKFDAPQDLDRSFHVRHTLEDMAPGSYNIKIEFDTSIGTFTCTNAKDLYFWVSSQGLAPSNADVAIGNENRLYAVDDSPNQYYELDIDTLLAINTVSSTSTSPSGIGGTSRLYACDNSADDYYELDPDTLIAIKTVSSTANFPYGMGGMSDRLFSCDNATGFYYEIDPNTLLVLNSVVTSPLIGVNGIGGMLNRLFSTSFSTDKYYELDPDTLLPINTVNSTGSAPTGMGGIDTRLYSCDGGTDRYYEIDPNTLLVLNSVASVSSLANGIGGTK